MKLKEPKTHFRKLDMAMLKELLPQHNEGKRLNLRAKEARKELEEIFGREMDGDKQSRSYWEKD